MFQESKETSKWRPLGKSNVVCHPEASHTSTVAPVAASHATAATSKVAVQGPCLVTSVLVVAHVARLSSAHVTAVAAVPQHAYARLTAQFTGVAPARVVALTVTLNLATQKHVRIDSFPEMHIATSNGRRRTSRITQTSKW